MKSRTKAPDAPTRTLTRGNNQVPQNGFWRSPPASVWNESAEIRDFFYQTPNAGFCSLRTDNKRLKHIREAFIAFSRLVYDCYLFSNGYSQTQTKRYQTLNGKVSEINKILGVYPWSGCGSVAAGHIVGAPAGGLAGLALGVVGAWWPQKLRLLAYLTGFRVKRDPGRWKKFYRRAPAGGVRSLDPDQRKIKEHLSINNLLHFVNILNNRYNLTVLKFHLIPG